MAVCHLHPDGGNASPSRLRLSVRQGTLRAMDASAFDQAIALRATGPGRYRLTGMVKTAGIIAGYRTGCRTQEQALALAAGGVDVLWIETMSSPEVARVYVGSFWDESLRNLDNAELFEAEEKDLMKDLAVLPRQSAVRKINEVCQELLQFIKPPL